MLKKKNIFVAIFSFLFCFSMMFGNVLINDKNVQQNTVYADVTYPTFFESEESAADGSWTYVESNHELTLNGVNWENHTLELPDADNFTVNIVGENTIQNADMSIFKLYGDTSTITFKGTGILNLSVTGEGITMFGGAVSSRIILDGLSVKEEIADSETIDMSEAINKQKIVIFGQVALLHSHSYTYSANGAALTATCDCGESTLTGSVSVEDIYLNESLVPVFDMSALSLTEDSFNIEYRKVETKGSVEGGELVSEPNSAVGYYYLKATPKTETGISEDNFLVYAFEVKKLQTVITGEDRTITYNGESYDLSQMFTFDEYAGEKTYSIVTEGTTGVGTVHEGNKLFIEKAGVINIKVVASGQDGYEGAELVKSLTVQKLNPVLGTGEGEVYLVIKGYNERNQEVDYNNGWVEGSISYVLPVFVNNVGGGAITTVYYKITDDGEEEINYFSSEAGKYKIVTSIEDSDVRYGYTLSGTYEIKEKIDIQVADISVPVYYNEFVDSKYDISKRLINLADFAEDIESITYFHVKSPTEKIEMESTMFEVISISNGVEGDEYTFEAVIQTKTSSSLVSNTISFSMFVKKYDGLELSFDGNIFDNQPCTYEVVKNDYNAVFTIEYYLGETLLDSAPINAGKYNAKVIVEETEFTRASVKNIRFSIDKREVSIVWQEDDFTYNSEEQTISAYYVDLEENEIPLKVIVNTIFKNVSQDGTNAYEYTATAIINDDSGNYTLPQEKTKAYHIKPMKVSVEVLNRSKFYKIAASPKLSAKVVSGKVFVGDREPWTLRVDAEININTPIGFYPIIAESTNDPNYEVTFTNSATFRVKNRILTDDMIRDWVYLQESNEPSAEVDVGEVRFSYYKGEELLTSVPTEPGEYRLIARVGENEQDVNWAEQEEIFIIDRITVNVPKPDTTVYVYDGLPQSYKIMDSDLANAALYTIGENEFRDAGTHKVSLIIKDTVHYRWPNNEDVFYMNFVIMKKQIEKPVADNRVYKYNGKSITYSLPTSEYYQISDNTTQSEVGRYKITVQLEDTINTVWSDGTNDDLVYDFVINQSKVDNPIVKDAEGNAINTKDVSIVDISGNGISPESILQVEVSKEDDIENINRVKTQLSSVMSKYDKIFKVADVKLVQYGVSIQPENSITLKMLIPEELNGANFKLYHIHTDSYGEQKILEVEYSKVDKDGYITFQTDKLSSFVFVYEQSSLKAQIITFSVLSGVMFILLVLQVIMFIMLKKKSKAKILAAAAPVFFVKSEVSSTIALGCVFGVLLVANIVLLVLNILAYRKKKCNDTQAKEKPRKNTKSKTAESK